MKAHLSHKIAADLVASSLEIFDIISQPSCIQLFLHSLSHYDIVYERVSDEDKKTFKDPRIYIQPTLSKVLNWLGRKCCLWYKDELRMSLQVNMKHFH